MAFGDLKTDKGVKALNDYLADRSYIEGYVPSQADVTTFKALGKAPASSYPHALRWYNHISSFGSETSKFPSASSAAPVADSKPAPADDDDDDVDLFGSDDEEDEAAEKIKQERIKAYSEKKSKKPALIPKSSIVLDVKPWDDETNMEEMEKSVRTITCDGLIWGQSKFVPLAYGIKKLQIGCVIEDDKVSVDWLTEEIQNFEDLVQSVDIAAHTDAKAVCHICGATLKSSRYLHHHLLLHKDVEKPHKCDKCGKSFFSSSALKVHHYYNHEEHPGRFQCTVCGKNFKAKQGLQFHMDSHSNELRYECSYCHKRFRGFKTCRVHELRHREANEPNKFNCSICGKLFKTRQTLKNHEDVHASFNRYQCSLCEKRFKLRKSCLAHIRVHHTDHERLETQHATVPDEGEVAIESLLADGEEYVVTLEEAPEVEGVLLEEGQEETMEIIVPDADVECEVENVS